MKLTGKVISYQENKKFGFIKGNDGTSYFFHISNIDRKHKSRVSELKIGSLVAFEAAAEPKGMAARYIEFVETYKASYSPSFKNYRKEAIPTERMEEYRDLRTRYYKSPNDARDRLLEMAKESGANVLHSVNVKRVTWSSGNYRYSMHQALGTIGVYTIETEVLEESDVEKLANEVSEKVQSFTSLVEPISEQEESAISRQTATRSSGCLPVFIIIMFFFMLFLF